MSFLKDSLLRQIIIGRLSTEAGTRDITALDLKYAVLGQETPAEDEPEEEGTDEQVENAAAVSKPAAKSAARKR